MVTSKSTFRDAAEHFWLIGAMDVLHTIALVCWCTAKSFWVDYLGPMWASMCILGAHLDQYY